jgi:hypothetical protein
MTSDPVRPAGGGGDPHPPQAPARPGPGRAGERPGSPAGQDHEEVDVLYLAGQRPAAGGSWLLVTGLDPSPGGGFTAHVLGGAGPSAFGGDVVAHLAPDDPPGGQPPPAARVDVYVVLGGRLIPVAAWPGCDLDGWPERIRPAVAFAMGMLTELEEYGADLGAEVDLGQAAPAATAGVPLHITFPGGKAAPAMLP